MRHRGFTLVELIVALVLLALMAAVLFGSLGLAGTTLDRGEAKVDATSGMRLAQAFLRANLEAQHPQKAHVVKLRFFAGCSLEETAQHLGISRATAQRHWAYARAWLFGQLHQT